ncbi:MAG: hypothetical protein EOM55_04460 [Clostridia bacterium]|nr:hypothetical protein [Clostridia bacterium]
MLFGNGIYKTLADLANNSVRSMANFNWTFIALLAFVIYVYAVEIKNKNYKAIVAGLSLYSVHWLYEIINAIIAHISGYALWTVSPESTSYILLIGVSWELSMMFAVAGIITSKFLLKDKYAKILGINNRWFFAIANALMFSLIEIFLASTPAFIWVYPWWGAIPVFLTVYIPFFLAAFLVPDRSPKFQKIFLGSIISLNIILLVTLVPLGII